MQTNTPTALKTMALDVTTAQGQTFQYELKEDASVFVGSSSTCGLRLSGKGVEDIHCMLLSSDGELRVHGWHTGSTSLNGVTITDEAELRPGDVLAIGDHQIVFGVAVKATAPESQSEPAPLPTPSPIQSERIRDEIPTPPMPVPPPSRSEVETVAMDDFDFDPACVEDFDSEGSLSTTLNSEDSLALEVEQLRIELAHRDAQVAELMDQQGDGFANDTDDETTVRLVNRLEDLLEELEDSDRRSLELEQLLRLSDEATQAEREEREHLETWMSEIENRVSQRELESEAQLERLQSKLDETRTRLEQSESQVNRVLQSTPGESGTSDDSMLVELQQQNADLESRLHKQAEESELLRDQLENSDELESALAETQRLEQKMLQMEVETSRERAELAREKAELLRTQDELEKQMREQAEMSDSDTRFTAMRQHLRERYESEKSEREERRSRSLGGRISQLLKSVKR